MRARQASTGARGERAILVQVVLAGQNRDQAEDSLAELRRLAETAGAEVVGSITQRRDRPTAAFHIGEGKLQDVQLACRQAEAGLVIFDNDLTPSQVNNLDLALEVKVIDRTELILQIFARRARTAEAQTQVELAQLQYLVTRIPVSAKQHRFTGGIGMRGPGENPFQLRSEPMRQRIRDLRRRLETIRKRRRLTRGRRQWPVAALVGYTNAGKSTLLNALTRSHAYVDDRLFATLDTKTRQVYLGQGRRMLLTDTVGFIRHLPHGLVACFRSTLEEVAEADLLLHVADAGHAHVREHCAVVRETLEEIEAGGIPTLLVFNKVDLPDAAAALPALLDECSGALAVSAATRAGMDALKWRMAAAVGTVGTAHWGE